MKGFEDVENKTGRLRSAASLSLALWLIMCMLLPSPAYASDGDGGGHSFGTGDWAYGIVEGPKFLPNRDQLFTSSWGWIIYAPNKYDAALYVCGMEPSEVSSVTAEQRAKLSNESTGGAFYTLANRIYKVGGGSIPTWANADLIRTLFSAEDTDYVFRLEVDDMQAVNDAKADLQTILDGGDLGGGGGGSGDVSDTVTLTNKVGYIKIGTQWLEASTYNYVLHFDDTAMSYINDKIEDCPYVYYQLAYKDQTTYHWEAVVYLTSNQMDNYAVTGSPSTSNNSSVLGGRLTGTYYKVDKSTFTSSTLVIDGNTVNIYFTGNSYNKYGPATVSNGTLQQAGSGLAYVTSTESTTPTIPPSQWPDTEPQTPTQPTVPSPTSISITISSQPTFYFEPTITTNTNYTNTTYDGTDYSKQLKSIYDELKAFHVDNNTGLNSVLSNFGEIADGLEALGDDLDQQINWIFMNLKTDIDTNFSELKDYLKELFEWLADELDFTVSGGGYSDSTVVSWLKKIWSKIGSGVDTRPTDPTVDPFSALDWLLRFISTLIDGLADKASDLSEDLQDLLDNISGKFPFSIPWDVVAILTLFAGEPVAPAIDYDVAIWGDIRFEADIDLSEYDSVMEVVRPMELIAFAAYLLWLTPEVLDSMDVTKGMGSS